MSTADSREAGLIRLTGQQSSVIRGRDSSAKDEVGIRGRRLAILELDYKYM